MSATTVRKLILIRGPSGTGKSTIASLLSVGGCTPWFEADQFFTRGAEYKFSASKLKSAHALCHLQTERAMFHSIEPIVVTNTFIAHWEMEAYLELAEEYKYVVEIIRSPGPWDANTLFERNKHSVPLDVVQRHIRGYQPHPDETEWTDLTIFAKNP